MSKWNSVNNLVQVLRTIRMQDVFKMAFKDRFNGVTSFSLLPKVKHQEIEKIKPFLKEKPTGATETTKGDKPQEEKKLVEAKTMQPATFVLTSELCNLIGKRFKNLFKQD